MRLLLQSIKQYATDVALLCLHIHCYIAMRTQMWFCNAMPTVCYVPDVSGAAARSDDFSERGPAISKANNIGSTENEEQGKEPTPEIIPTES